MQRLFKRCFKGVASYWDSVPKLVNSIHSIADSVFSFFFWVYCTNSARCFWHWATWVGVCLQNGCKFANCTASCTVSRKMYTVILQCILASYCMNCFFSEILRRVGDWTAKTHHSDFGGNLVPDWWFRNSYLDPGTFLARFLMKLLDSLGMADITAVRFIILARWLHHSRRIFEISDLFRDYSLLMTLTDMSLLNTMHNNGCRAKK